MRRLLLLPALALVLMGAPVLALQSTAPPVPTTEDLPVSAPVEQVAEGWVSTETPVDATLMGVRWNGDPGAEFTVEVQRADGTWDAAEGIAGDDTEPDAGTPDAARQATQPGPEHATDPVWLGEDATAVRVGLEAGAASDVTVAAIDSSAAVAPSGSAGALGVLGIVDGPDRYGFALALLGLALLLVACAFRWSPRRLTRGRVPAFVALGAIVLAACVPAAPPPPPAPPTGTPPGQPAMTSRASWGGDLAFKCAGGPVSATSLKFAVVHHTAGSNSYAPGNSVGIIRGIYAYHVNTLGYCDVAYNFFVDKYGQIFEGRWGGTDKPIIGGHSGGFNTSSTGIAVLGNYQTSNVPAAGWDAVVRLLRWKLSVHGVDPALGFSTVVASSPCGCMHWPAGTLVSFPNAIVGHRELDATLCPGGSFFAQFGALRSQVQSGISIPPPTTTTVL